MKKLMKSLLGAATYCVLAAVPAFAAPGYPPKPDPGGGTTISRGPDSTAFTGAEITVWMFVLAALVMVGVLSLLAGRRRSQPVAANHQA